MDTVETHLAAFKSAALRGDEDAAAAEARAVARAMAPLRPQRVSLPPMPRALIEEALTC
ncbi:hypothetical protein K7H20_23850 [Salipiger manganoxidans]|uniref:hypothetical protein n=1 Tax=Salipiger marinus TaxID=555512 RepID=UPI001E5D84DE|nr:hypothetical protein [Salipiger manganoxidans]MCD1621074.1 hypothetical protein [Salipiger manganoxidans]